MEAGGEFYSWYVVYCVVNAFLCCTAIMFNIITIHAINKTSSLPKPLKTLLLSLAVSDLGVGLLVHPLYVATLVMEMKTKDNPIHSKTYLSFASQANLFLNVSFAGVTALSADRFLAVHLHLRYQELVTHKRVVAVVTSLWLLSAVFSLVTLWTPVNVIYPIVIIIVVACLITAAFLNYKIYMAVRRHAHQIQALQVQQVAPNGEVPNVGRVRKSAEATIYIYLVFLVCYLPQASMLLFTTITSSNSSLNTVIFRGTLSLVLLNSSLNPVIYCWKMRNIRHALMEILRNTFSSGNN